MSKYNFYIIRTDTSESEPIYEYKTAIATYRQEKLSQHGTIEMFGNSNGKYELMFSKDFNHSKFNDDTYRIIIEIENMIRRLEERKTQLYGMQGILDKKRDVLFHEIEGAGMVSDRDKINTYNEIRALSAQRRGIKKEMGLMSTLVHIAATSSLSKIVEASKSTLLKQKDEIKAESPSTIIKEVPYRDHKERIQIFSQMQKEYHKVHCDEIKKMIVGYNKCYK